MEMIFQDDSYARSCAAVVADAAPEGVRLNRTVFYPTGGGQPGDHGALRVAGAIEAARALGPGHVVVTMLCDYGNRYQSKLYNPAFLREKGLPVPSWLDE